MTPTPAPARTQTGALFHMMGALSPYAKVGLTTIGNSRGQADVIYASALEALDRESRR